MSWIIQPEAVFKSSPVVPVMVINELDDAVPMAKALASGGINIFEITLRTPAALAAITAIRAALPDALVGAGTVINTQQYDDAVAAGAQFIISPGYSEVLLKHAKESSVALIPGVATPSEIVTALEHGYDHLKFFPAEANGGAPALKSISGPLPQVKFCPTGGISPKNIADYRAIKSVATVGGSWMLPNDVLESKDWAKVEQLAKEAVNL
ncbi:bifunctional 4-hydroxy-2-oxoglutarate aldolase/2-dehydro-3-deoxy-phosphogluconate aldolase [Vibrio aphrogenes]|uniref:bifunctional 4-hydroxy-2-oxoglutarate aldolase/2-dehydro-3-deoxy-phosphogluconate aldolase n=1 Tax=Vibrio aphrogenes TaxID=1891186 RepID=UPI000B35F164|nr:bifunctional 4-hydroxy-2-oxoglutarate aldolase/2-dehydro-3-deoxy-phosphogluconate aldolase [Vibrio aphrogenes]